jgi:hypothetical protein
MDQDAAIRQAEKQLMSKANVTGVGMGERGGKAVMQVFVTRKLPESEVAAGDLIPKSVAGYPTDVVEIGVVSTQAK